LELKVENASPIRGHSGLRGWEARVARGINQSHFGKVSADTIGWGAYERDRLGLCAKRAEVDGNFQLGSYDTNLSQFNPEGGFNTAQNKEIDLLKTLG
jgi:hypothetical protein